MDSVMIRERDIIGRLRTAGHRITAARSGLIRALLAAKAPLSALDAQKMLRRRKIEPNVVTLYRELAFLEREGVVRGVTFDDGVKRFEVASDAHRHHLICIDCRTVLDMEMDHDLDRVERKIRREKSFTVKSHSLEFYGLCSRCA